MSNPCLVLLLDDCEYWTPAHGGGKQIALAGRPTVLQPDRATAEAEAKRLARVHGKKFAVFEAAVLATTVQVPSHITVSGRVWNTRTETVLVDIDDSEIPF